MEKTNSFHSYAEFNKDKFIGYTPSFIHSAIDSLKEIRDEKKSSWTGRIVSEIKTWLGAKTIRVWLLSFSCIVEFNNELKSIRDLIKQLQKERDAGLRFSSISIQGTVNILNNALAEKMNSFAGRVVCEIKTWDDNNIVAKTVREWLLSFPYFSEIADEIKNLQDLTAQFKNDEVFADNFWKLKPFDRTTKGLQDLQDLKLDDILFNIPIHPVQLNCLLQRTLNYPEEQIKLLQKIPLNAQSIIFTADVRADKATPDAYKADIHYPALADETIKFLMGNQPSVWTVVICAHHQTNLSEHLKNYTAKELFGLGESISFLCKTDKKQRLSYQQAFIKMAYTACSSEHIKEFVAWLIKQSPFVFSDILETALREHSFFDEVLLYFANYSIEATNVIIKVFPLFILNLSEDLQKNGSQNLSPDGLLTVITQNLQILPSIPLKTALLALQIQIEKNEEPCPELISHIIKNPANEDIIALLRNDNIHFLHAISYLIENHHLLDTFTNLELAFALVTNFSDEIKSKIIEKINDLEFKEDVEILKLICGNYKIPSFEFFRQPPTTPLPCEIINWLLKIEKMTPHHLHHSKEILKTLKGSGFSFLNENQAPLHEWGEIGSFLWYLFANQQTDFPKIPEWAKKDLYSSLEFCASLINSSTMPIRLRLICVALELNDEQIARFETYFMRRKNPKKFEYAMDTSEHLGGFLKDHVLPNFVFDFPSTTPISCARENLSIDYIQESIMLKEPYIYDTKVEVKKGLDSTSLPLEIFLSIFKFCDPYDTLRFAPTCTHFYNHICREPSVPFWQSQGFSSVGALRFMDGLANHTKSIYSNVRIEQNEIGKKIQELHGKPSITQDELNVMIDRKKRLLLKPLFNRSNELAEINRNLQNRLSPLLLQAWPQNFYRALSKRKLYSLAISKLLLPPPNETPAFHACIHTDFQSKKTFNPLDHKFLDLFASSQNSYYPWFFLRHNPQYFAYINWISIPLEGAILGMSFEALKPFCEGVKKSFEHDINQADAIKSRAGLILQLAVEEHPCFDFEANLTTPIFNALT